MAVTASETEFRSSWRPHARRRGAAVIGVIAALMLLLITVSLVVGPSLWRADPTAQDADARLQGFSTVHPLGTDQLGRDLLARLLVGGRWTVAGAALVCAGVNILGFAVGALSATSGRLTNIVLARLMETLMALPALTTALVVTAMLGPSFRNVLVALTLTSWPWFARVYHGLVRSAHAAPYVEGAVAIGAGRARIVLRHLSPNLVGPVIVLATANLGAVMVGLASLSFLGLGVQRPTPEWGAMINDARLYFQLQPWQMIAPGLCIVVTVLCVNLAGDALRDALDPRTGRR